MEVNEEKQADSSAKLDRGEMKRLARDAMRGRSPSVFLVALVFLLVAALLNALSVKLEYPNLDYSVLSDAILSGDDATVQVMLTENAGLPGQLLELAVNLMSIVIGFGFACYCLNIARKVEDAGFGNLLDPFGYFLRAVMLSVGRALLVLVWTFLLIVPGVVAAYRYSFAHFILIDNPDKPPLECLRESKRLTNGHKWELFLLDVSFIGWRLLGLIPFVSCFVAPYVEVTRANYYRMLSGRMEPPAHVDVTV